MYEEWTSGFSLQNSFNFAVFSKNVSENKVLVESLAIRKIKSNFLWELLPEY